MNLIRVLSASAGALLIGASLADGALAPYRSAILADGAVAYYQFDETTGTTAVDATLTPDNGTIGGNGFSLGQTSAFAGLGTALGLNGTNSNVVIGADSQFDLGTGAFSIELWYNAAVLGRGDLFTYKNSTDFGIHSDSQGDNTVSIYHDGFVFGSNTASPINQWHYLVYARDGLSNATLYLDGAVVQTGTDSKTISASTSPVIGSNVGGIYFNGSLDEVAFYDSALSSTQVTNHYALAQVPEPCSLLMGMLSGLGLLGLRRPRA